MNGTTTADRIDGGAGNDTLTGGAGNDTLIGGTGTDQAVFSAARSNYIITVRADGSTTITDTRANGDGTDTFSGIESFRFTDQTVTLATLLATANRELSGTSGNDSLTGNVGSDTLTGGAGSDTLDGGAGTDIAKVSGARVNYAVTQYANGTVTITDGRGTDGVDTLVNMESVQFSDQTVALATLLATANRELIGTSGNDHLTGNVGNDTLSGGSGNDTLDGGAGNDRAVFSGTRADHSVVVTADGRTLVVGADGTRTMSNIETVQFSDQTIALADLLATANRELVGTSGADSLFGGTGDDTLTGGAGNDTLIGGAGHDRAVMAGARADYVVTQFADGSVSLASATETERLRDVEIVQFADLTSWTNELLTTANREIIGTAGADVLTGGVGHDTITGGAGNDTIDGGAGVDIAVLSGVRADYIVTQYANGTITIAGGGETDHVAGIETVQFSDGTATMSTLLATANREILGTSGADSLTGGVGNDTLSGGAGNDRLIGGDGNDDLYGGAGVDDLFSSAGADRFFGGDGDDWIYIGAGDIVADGGTGWDKVFMSFGADLAVTEFVGIEALNGTWGSDLIDLSRYNSGFDVYCGSGNDTLIGSSGTDTASFVASRSAYTIVEQADGELVITHVSMPEDVLRVRGVEHFTFNGTTYARADLVLPPSIDGTAGDDSLFGTAGNEVINGLEGNDVIVGGSGFDTIDGGAGTDTLVLDVGWRVYDTSISNIEIIQASAVDDAIDLTGFTGDFDIRLSGGHDSLATGAGNDTVSVDSSATGWLYMTGIRADYVVVDEGFGSIRLTDQRAYGGQGSDLVSGVSLFRFTDGDFTMADLVGDGVTYGTEGDDYMYGTYDADVMAGLGGNDSITGYYGTDHITGGDGNDNLDGGSGSDTMIGGAGDDFIGDSGYSYGPEDVDTAVFSGNRSDYVVIFSQYGGTEIQIHDLRQEGDGSDRLNGIERIEFADSAYTNTSIRFFQGDTTYGDDNIVGMATDDNIDGNHGNDTIDGGAGNDSLYGSYGNDVLMGGAGSNHLGGGEGADTFLVRASDLVSSGPYSSQGQSTLHDFVAGTDQIVLQGITADQVTMQANYGSVDIMLGTPGPYGTSYFLTVMGATDLAAVTASIVYA